jgi:DNA-binding MarR family transcriptional regulator
MISPDIELDLLERIHRSKSAIRQRDLARIIGLSLGMTNSILKRLAQKGLLKVKKVNNRNIQYVVSPKGIEKLSLRSYRYVKRTIRNVVYYKEAIDGLVMDAAQRGYRRLALIGRSDLDFIVEHVCQKHKLEYLRATDREFRSTPAEQDRDGTFVLYSENSGPPHPEPANVASLRLLFMSRPVIPAAPGEL